MQFSLIFASTTDDVIGVQWTDRVFHDEIIMVPSDKEHFKLVTQYSPSCQENLLIVGRKTWETIPAIMRNCKRRRYLVLTKQVDYSVKSDNPKARIPIIKHDFTSVLQYCLENRSHYYKFFVIGGAEIYQQAIKTGLVTEIYHTRFHMELISVLTSNPIPTTFNYVHYRPDYDSFKLIRSKQSTDQMSLTTASHKIDQAIDLTFNYYTRKYLPFETQYLSLINDIFQFGTEKSTRNGTTISLTDRQIQIDLADGFPIITLRKSYWKGIKEELLWMMSGSTNVNILKNQNVHIWDKHSSREYLDQIGLTHLSEGDIGPGYGFQMRSAGAKYIDCQTKYPKCHEFDQLTECVNLIKNDPNSRRIIINLWNVNQLKEMSLPPCHMNYQFTVTNGKLNCHLYQRSWDVMLGWNTSTVALLTHLMAHFCDLKPGTITHTICDVHIYQSHLEAYRMIKDRVAYPLPKLEISGPKPDQIDQYQSNQLQLVDYQSHPHLSMEIVV